MRTARVFRNGGSQAIRLPKEFQFSSDEVYVNRIGNVVVLLPRSTGWKAMADSIEGFTEDFMAERPAVPEVEVRRSL